ncbi:hypothetical protein BH10CYA1_BH10CYA1_04120 [soil metagenome]
MSFWNPIDDAKSIVKQGSELAHSSLHTATKLCEESYDTAKAAVKTVRNIDTKALRLAEVFGESAINAGILKPLDGITQLASSGLDRLTGYKLPTLELGITVNTKGLGLAGNIAEVAGAGVGFIAPVVVTGGMTDALAGAALATKTGDAVDVANVVKVAESPAVVPSAVEGSSTTEEAALSKFRNSNWKTAADGGVTGVVFTPTGKHENGFVARLKTGTIDAATFGAMGAAAKGVTKSAEAAVGAPLDSEISVKDLFDQRSAEKLESAPNDTTSAVTTKVKLAHATGRQTGAAVAGASTYTETSSLLYQHRLANPEQVINTTGQYLVKSASTNSVRQAKSFVPPPEVVLKI